MGALYDLKTKIERIIQDKNLDAASVRGTIGLKAGFLLAFVTPDTPDDPVKIDKLKRAAEETLKTILP